MAIDLTVPGLESLHLRAGEKWAAHDADVLSATIAEMDFPLAPPVAEALHRAIDRDDLGYPGPARATLRRSSPASPPVASDGRSTRTEIVLVPDVMVGWSSCAGRSPDPGSRWRSPPGVPAVLRRASSRRCEADQRGSPRRRLDRPRRTRRGAGGRRPGAGAGQPPQSDRSRSTTRRTRGDRRAVRGTRGVGPGGRDPCAADAPRRDPSPVARGIGRGTPMGVTVTSASKAFNLAALKAALIVTADPAARDLVARMPPLHEHAGLLGVIAAEAAFDDGDPWLDAVIAQLDANRDQLGETSRATCPRSPEGAAPQATYLAWLDCTGPRPRRRARGDLPRPGASRARPRPRLRRARRRPRPPQLRHGPEHLSDTVARMSEVKLQGVDP